MSPPTVLFLSAKNPDPELAAIQSKAVALGFQTFSCTTLRQALRTLGIDTSNPDKCWNATNTTNGNNNNNNNNNIFPNVVITKLGGRQDEAAAGTKDRLDTARGVDLLRLVRLLFARKTFVVFHSRTACRDAVARWHLFQSEYIDDNFELSGCNMVSDNGDDICQRVLQPIAEAARLRHTSGANYTCPWCGMTGLTVRALWLHAPLYHINDRDKQKQKQFTGKQPQPQPQQHSQSQFLQTAMSRLDSTLIDRHEPNLATCSICNQAVRGSLQDHIFVHHGPHPSEHQRPQPQHVSAFALVVCLHQNNMLLVQERANVGYWLPGGHVDGGESLTKGALRETLEEAGVHVQLTGVLQVQYNPIAANHVRLRVIFMAQPAASSFQCKTVPDFESTAAAWVPLEDVRTKGKLVLRNSEPQHWANYLAQGGVVHSMDVLSDKER